jgi:putative DNA primase/helicase
MEVVDYSDEADQDAFEKRHNQNDSALTALRLIRANNRDVLGGRRLRLNEMTGDLELGADAITDDDEFEIRTNLEARFFGGFDKDNRPKGLKLSGSDVHAACSRVARDSKYHPVRDYLGGLKWDGVDRLDSVCEDILSAQRTQLNQVLIRKWFISAVARVSRPGCKADTALVLVGKQGVGKSSFFAAVAGDWFVDTAIDIHNKDAFQVLRRAWVYESSELETMRRAKEVAAVKAFLSTQVDTYRPPYGRNPVKVPRGCVIVGTTNSDEFLTDDTGNRRFWPIKVGETNLTTLVGVRDQLWAEAVTLYRAGERWWLTEAESAPLHSVHQEYQTSDPWAQAILKWASESATTFGTAEVLEQAVELRIGEWSTGEARRVVSILRMAGWTQGYKRRYGTRPWIRPDSTDAL